MQKRAQALSLNTVVIAALVVLVLVILSFIFMGSMTQTTAKLNKCPAECHEGYCDSGYQELSDKVCYTGGEPDDYKKCCIKLDI